jgi:acetoin:2,6-dichlorophenolindophenol oxidoreductase subunit alpha
MTLSQHAAAPPELGSLTRLTDADLDSLLLIRHFEWRVLELFAAGMLAGTTHTCLGQEYVPVALSALLDTRDMVFSNHRGHGHYLARHAEPAGLLAEMMGRQGAICQGVGGSQHLFRPGFLATGVQGQSLPVAVGAALDLRRAGDGGLAVSYIGDGTWGQGVVYEALNMAALWSVPLLVVVENNAVAQSTPVERHLAGSIAGRAEGLGIAHVLIDEPDINVIRARLREPVAALRRSPRPLIAEFMTDRLGPHSKGDDTRDDELIARLQARDWYRRYAAAFGEQFASADARQRELIDSVVREVSARPLVAGKPE